MARPTQTRRRVIETAAALFQRQGYSATGLNQVLAEGKAPKGSLYFHFPGGKEELAVEACAEVYGSWRALLLAQFAAWGVPEEDAGDLADLVLSGVEGALVLARVRRDATVVRTVTAALGEQVARAAGVE